MKRKIYWHKIFSFLMALSVFNLGQIFGPRFAMAQPTGADLYIKDTIFDVGSEPNSHGIMWLSEDIWVRTTPDPGYKPYPYLESGTPSYIPLPHQNPEYRDPLLSTPNYVYVRVHNRGGSASSGTEQLHLYWAKASTGLSWNTQWVDYLPNGAGTTELYGAEITKPRKNAASPETSQNERDAYRDAVLAIGQMPAFVFPGGVSYWNKQDEIHAYGPTNRHGVNTTTGFIPSDAFLPWHREYINRYELLLQEVNPTVKLLYWDWTTNPQPAAGFNFFTTTFMGASGRSTGGTSIGLPFMPSLVPIFAESFPANNPPFIHPVDASNNPDVFRALRTTPSATISDSRVLDTSSTSLNPTNTYPVFAGTLERNAHNPAHVYINGNQAIVAWAAEDPFFFLLHGKVDELWSRWQRDPANLWRLDIANAYDCNPNVTPVPSTCTRNNPNIETRSIGPWDGSTGPNPARPTIQPWVAPSAGQDDYRVTKFPRNASVVSPPIYDTAPLVIPILQQGEAVVIQIPWYPPNPANFASFGADRGHFCLLSRIETAPKPQFGMTFLENTDVYDNTRNNNNIAWKNLTVADNFTGALGLQSILVRNIFEESVLTGLRFANTAEIDTSFFGFGHILVDLKPDLYERWREGGSVGEGIEPIGGTVIRIESPEAFIQNLNLKPGEVFSVDVNFELSKDYPLVRPVLPKWDFIQIGTPKDPEAMVGGQRFEIDFNKLVQIKAGSEWRYLDNVLDINQTWTSPDFDDSDWKQGRAAFGFGNVDATNINSGLSDERSITTYFRHTFDVADPSFFRNLYVGLRRNDGAVVYLNGSEIHRINLPEEEITTETLATYNVTGLEGDVFFPIEVNPELVQQGTNVIAVEIHLADINSQDLSFDLELYANPTDTRLLPNIAFASPANGALFQTDQVIPIEIETLDTDGTIMSVSLLVDGELIGTNDGDLSTFQWEGASLGSHQLQAVAVDNDQMETVTNTTITVLENTPPFVDLTQPSEGTMFRVGEAIPIVAQASDPGGKISRVEFYLQRMLRFDDPAVLVGTVETEPYEISLEDIEPGDYMLVAIAIDDGEIVGKAVPIMIMIHD